MNGDMQERVGGMGGGVGRMWDEGGEKVWWEE